METKDFKPYVIVIVAMVLTTIAVAYHGGSVQLIMESGVRMEVPERVGQWSGSEMRFCHNPDCRWRGKLVDLDILGVCPECGEPLFTMSRAESLQLPEDTEFVKAVYTNDAEQRLQMSIVLSGAHRNSIHRPQRCLPGQGFNIREEHTIQVPIEDRSDDLGVHVIENVLGSVPEDHPDHYNFYAYWFMDSFGRETPSHYMRMLWLAWDRVIYSKSPRWAYISISGNREPTGREYEEDLKDFVAQLSPRLNK